MNNGIFIPIEIMRREYISKLLLSIEFIRKGMPVIIGHKGPVTRLALKSKEPGVFFYKSSRGGGNEKLFDSLKEKGFAVVAQDEESGIIFEDFIDFYMLRKSLQNIDTLDMYFTWGNDDCVFLANEFNKKQEIVYNFGGIRACFWGQFGKKYYIDTIKNINNKFGKYVLFVSNLATYNEFLNSEQSIKHASQYEGFNLDEYNKLYKAEEKVFKQYIDLIKILTTKLNKIVIVRPHPSENINRWEKEVNKFKNVYVEHKGELLTWILASDFIIQNNCTSSIEASAANIPVITYIDDEKDLTSLSYGKENIPNKLSLNTFGKEQFIETIENIDLIWNNKENKLKREEFLNRKLKDYGTIEGARNIAKKVIEYVGEPNKKGNVNLGRDSIMYDICEIYRCSKLRPKSTSVIMDLNKRETLSKDKIKKDIENLLTTMQIDKKVNIKRIEQNTFYLFPMENDYEN